MELIEDITTNGMFFLQREFWLTDNGDKVCRLMAMEVCEGSELDLTVITIPKYQRRGYATQGIKMLVRWAIQNGYKSVKLTNLFNSEIIDKIAIKLCFSRQDEKIWIKSIVGPLNL